MKRDFRLQTSDFRLVAVVLGLCAFVSHALALTENPYHSIVGRNAFALKPPTLPPVLTPPPAAPANVELRGITTLLGRPQVLLNFKIQKPPEPPKDRSLVMDVGQREGDVEVMEINPAAGTVRIRNQGNELAMNLKDNAAKPQAVPGAGAPIFSPLPGGNPAVPAPGGGSAPAAGSAPNVTTFGGGAATATGTPSTRPALPSRNLRDAVPNDARSLPLEAQRALIEVERERTKGKGYPPLPNF